MTEINVQELHARIQDFRKKISQGIEVTDDELRTAIADLHAYRGKAHTTLESASAKKAKERTKAKTKAEKQKEAEALLGDLL